MDMAFFAAYPNFSINDGLPMIIRKSSPRFIAPGELLRLFIINYQFLIINYQHASCHRCRKQPHSNWPFPGQKTTLPLAHQDR